GAALGAVLWFARSDGAKPVVVAPNSVAVIDPRTNALVGDVPVGLYPIPLAADNEFVYVGNTGAATMSRISPDMTVYDTRSLSRAIDLVAVRHHVWAADGGARGHTPAPPGTVLNHELSSAATSTIRVGPSVDGDEEETTLAADADGREIGAGNQSPETITQVWPRRRPTIHGIAPGGIALVTNVGAGDTVWATDPKRNLVVRIDSGARAITRRIPIPNEPS